MTVDQILQHPWVRGDDGYASDQPMCLPYIQRLHKLTESEKVYNDLKDEEGFISRDKILHALNLIVSSGESTSLSLPSEHKLLPEASPEHVDHGGGQQSHGSCEYDEETLEELLTQVTNCSNDPMNHETFVHFYILSTLTLVKKRRRRSE